MQAIQALRALDHVSARENNAGAVEGATRPRLAARATLTKRHFIAIARVLAEHKSKGNTDDVTRCGIARDLASYFRTQNVLFDRARFLSAARVEG